MPTGKRPDSAFRNEKYTEALQAYAQVDLLKPYIYGR